MPIELGFLLKKAITSCVLPPTGPLLLILIGLLLMRRRLRKTGTALIVLASALTLVLSTPWASNLLLASLQNFQPLNVKDTHGAGAIVVLAGGMRRNAPEYGRDDLGSYTLERLRYGVWLAKRTGIPLLVSGGYHYTEDGLREADTMVVSLREDYGMQARWVDSRSLDTADNATESARLLKAEGIRRVLLVTHAWHMERALLEFRTAGLEPVAAPTAYIRSGPTTVIFFLPSSGALQNSTMALHEMLGQLWSRLAR